MQDVLLARFVGRDAATTFGFGPAILTRLSTVISEITRNVVQHAGAPGVLRLGRAAESDRLGLQIVVSDSGRGMEDPQHFLHPDQVASLGAGLPGTYKLVDRLDLRSAPGQGTTVTMELWTRKAMP